MVSEQDFERLSAYIDRELPPGEQAALEQRLRDDPELRQELDELRIIVQAVRGLPAVQRPREYALTPEMVANIPPSPRFLVFPATRLVSALSSVAAALLLVAGGLLLLTSQSQPMADMAAAPVILEAVAQQPTETALQQEPPGVLSQSTAGAVTGAARMFATDTSTAIPQAAPMDSDLSADDAEVEEEAMGELAITAEEESAVAMEAENGGALGGATNAEMMESEAETFAADNLAPSELPPAPAANDADDGAEDDIIFESQLFEPTASPPPSATMIALPTHIRAIPTATPATVAENLPDSMEEVAPTAKNRVSATTITPIAAVILLVLGGLSVAVALGTFIQRRRDRGRT